jgi:hypothetical protein
MKVRLFFAHDVDTNNLILTRQQEQQIGSGTKSLKAEIHKTRPEALYIVGEKE